MPPKIRLDPKRLNAVYVPHLQNRHRTQIYFGGSSSGKSVFLATRAVLDTLQGRNTLVLRNVAKTIRGSCWNEIVKAIKRMGLSEYFILNKSDMLITALNNGAQILFAGLDDVEKIKSITPASDVLTDIWVEEATEIAYEDYKQLSKRLRGVSVHPKRMTLSFNPVYKTHWIYKEFFGIWDDVKRYAESGGLSILKTTYLDNRFLTQDDRDALENESDPYYRDVYTLGNWGVLGDLIFRNWRTEDLSALKKTADRLYFGADFGFIHPSAAVKVHFDRNYKRIYILDEIYERGITNAQFAQLVKPFVASHYVTCDCARPEHIAEFSNYGIRALHSKKGSNSVLHGIQWLQGYEIIVDLGCQNMRNELSLYQWRKDKDGNSIQDPVKLNDDLIDALRYALESESTAQVARIGSRAALGV